MMRILRIAILVFFVITTGVFAYTVIERRLTVDYNPPSISADEDVIMVSIASPEEDLLKGMRAVDNIDGDVTNTLMVVSKSKFIAKGTQMVNYAAFDKNKNVGTASREVIYIDYVSPRLHLKSPLRYAAGTTGIDYLKNMTAEDCLDGNITQQIKINLGNVTTISNLATLQQINVQVTNSGGDTSSLELSISMEDYLLFSQQAPALREYIAYVPCGGVIDLDSYVIGIWAAGNVKSFADAKLGPENVSVNRNGLDCNTPGLYHVVYSLTGNAGEELGTADLIVIVED